MSHLVIDAAYPPPQKWQGRPRLPLGPQRYPSQRKQSRQRKLDMVRPNRRPWPGQ